MAMGNTKPSLKSVYSPMRLTRPGARKTWDTLQFTAFSLLPIHHLAGHFEDLLAVAYLERRQQRPQFADEFHFLGIGDPFILEHVAQLGVERASDAAERLETRDGVAVLHARNVATHQAATFLQVAL